MADVVVAEFEAADRLLAGVRRLRAMGYSRLDAFTPYPVPELDTLLGLRRTKIPFVVLFAALTGGTLAYVIMAWTNATDYRLDVGGRPYNAYPAWVPIVFETLVLAASATAFAACLLASRLPRLHHRVFDLEGFERTSLDRFWITVGDLRLLRVAGPEVVDDEVLVLRSELEPLGAVAVRGVGRVPQRLEAAR